MFYIDLLNEKINREDLRFKLKSAVFNRKLLTLEIELIYPDNIILDDYTRTEVQKISKSEFTNLNEITVKYKKAYLDEDILNSEVKNFISKNYSRLVPENIVLDSNKNLVTIVCDNIYKEYLSELDITVKCNDYILKKFNENFEFLVEFVETIQEKEENTISIKREKVVTTFSIGNREEYIGSVIEGDAVQIGSIKEPIEGVICAGRITKFSEAMTKQKSDKNGNSLPSKKYFKFSISDFTGELNVVYFPSQANLPKMDKLALDLDVVLFGKIEEDNFNSGLVFRPSAINLCNFPKDFLDFIIKKALPENFTYIMPEDIVSEKQVNLFEMNNIERVHPYLAKNTFIVFDFETTGLDGLNDKIVEIGAVKVENGKATQIFSCLVNPGMKIPKESSAIHNIFDEDVANAFTIDKIIPDFYKFCYGSTLVAYNIDFDFKFLSIAGKKNGFIFDNPKVDALIIAKRALRGLLKNFRLGTVANYLNISLINAHRAVDDALATTEVFVKLVSEYFDLLNLI